MFIKRDFYLDKLIALKDKQVIKVIIGVRKSGKSILMEIFREYLVELNVAEKNIIYIDFDNYDYNYLNEPDKLYEYILSKLDIDNMNYIFLDEIRNVPNIYQIIESLYIMPNIDIYITCSNSDLLTNNFVTYLSGRYIEISILPLSFKEYIDYFGQGDLYKKYIDYITNSSFPYTIKQLNQKKELYNFLESVYHSIIIKDILYIKNINDFNLLERINRFIFENIGKTFSINKISETLTSLGRKADVKTITKYIDDLIASYMIYKVPRYNILTKELLKTKEQYYVVDIGLRYMLLGSSSTNKTMILKNIVYLELIRRGNIVYIGKNNELEIDFVSINEIKTTYYQVTTTLKDETTLNKKLNAFKNINDLHPKILLTLDEDLKQNYDGIKIINVLDWLLR